jgi:hypothetical protein
VFLMSIRAAEPAEAPRVTLPVSTRPSASSGFELAPGRNQAVTESQELSVSEHRFSANSVINFQKSALPVA